MRPELLNPLFGAIGGVKGVGPKLGRPLERLGIRRAIDALFHLPTGWTRRLQVEEVDEAQVGQIIAVEVTPVEVREGRGRAPSRIIAWDKAGNHLVLAFFNAAGWAKRLLPLQEKRIVCGRLERFGDGLQIVHPDPILEPGGADAITLDEPVYALSEGITSRRLASITQEALTRAPDLPEWIEPSLLGARSWPSWREAIAAVHGSPDAEPARTRLAYDEVFANQLALALVRQSARRRRTQPLAGDGRLTGSLALPYSPTGAQQRAIGEILGDLAQDQPMLRLLQGDVGSGKTLVAMWALLTAVEGGAQGAMLAPTEILARQHHDTLSRFLMPLGVNVALLTGRDKGRAREGTLMGLADGSVQVLVGTHAIFSEAVAYRRLGLVVVDEQHRFGVAQRLLLAEKAERPPHLLAMTATPIPRTLTLTRYGEMDVSRLDELPPGRQPIETRVLADARLPEVVDALGRHIAGDGQAYWVCPLVDESENSDLAAAEARAATLRARFGERVGLVHGRMKGPEKDRVVTDFAAGRLSVLVATVVIEVGVDVPNATLMVIEGADRFGLAQLHQLRGRVGRGTGKSTCLLLRGEHLSETARARLALMRETNDGFHIAEEDLRLRGGGEILGTRQSGEATFRLASPEQLQSLIGPATDDARLLLERDGGLAGSRGQAARTALYLFERDAGVQLLRSG